MANVKSLSVAQFILDRCGENGDGSLSPMQLLKLVYVAHGYMLGTHGRPLLTEPVEAWTYGPVVPSVYHALKQYRSMPVPSVPMADHAFPFDADEKEVMSKVAKVYGRHDGIVLSAATHKPGTPWSETWGAGHRSSPISDDLIEHFYGTLLKQSVHSSL
jgi:uncharacterized phage-associated protein